jgi:hypothetical protein
MSLPTHGNRPSCRASAVDPTRTGLAVLHGARDLHHLIGAVIHGGRPADAGIPAWARGPLLFPIDLEVACIKPLCGSRLPLTIGAHGTEQIHTVLTLAGDSQFSIEVARIDDMRGGQQTLPFERLMDAGCGRTVADRSSRGLHRRDDVGGIVLGSVELSGLTAIRHGRLQSAPMSTILGLCHSR